MVLQSGTRSKHHYHEIAKGLPSWDLTSRQLCDLEMILTGAFAPLQGFLTQSDYDSVVNTLRLTSGELWPIPITLDVSATFMESLKTGQQIALRDDENLVIALMTVESQWQPDKKQEALQVFKTHDVQHPGVDYLLHRTGDYYLGGHVEKVELPAHHDYRQHRHTPDELKNQFRKLGWKRVIAYHTDTVIHRSQQALSSRLARSAEANLLIHPVTGFNHTHHLDHFTRIRCYEHALEEYPEQTTMLSLLNMATRKAGPRDALLHALVRKNYGCTHFIVDYAHASPCLGDSEAPKYYDPWAALELSRQYADEMGIKIIGCDRMDYLPAQSTYLPYLDANKNETTQNLSETDFFHHLQEGVPTPEGFTYPKILKEIQKSCPPRYKQGLTVFFTGLSGSGKSTVANALRIKLLELGGRPVTLLDGDVVRKNLSSELTFSKEHRDLNIRRIGFVASEITKNGGIAICAPIAPYTCMRREVREMIETVGGYIEVHISTPLEECERRDRKGHYAKARAGLIKNFTGINDPYETPENPEARLDTTHKTPDECAHYLLLKLEKLGFIKV